MTIFIFANDAGSTLSSPVSLADTTISVLNSSSFPTPSVDQILILKIVSQTSSSIFEYVFCTQIVGNILTVIRAKENTVAKNWNTNDVIQNIFTAATLNNFQQIIFGTTSQRPIPTSIGYRYFDTTLTQPIFCSQITPSIIWVNAAGDIV